MKCLVLGVCAAGLGVELRMAVYSATAGVKVAFLLLVFERGGELMLPSNSDIGASAICSIGADVVWFDLWLESAAKDL